MLGTNAAQGGGATSWLLDYSQACVYDLTAFVCRILSVFRIARSESEGAYIGYAVWNQIQQDYSRGSVEQLTIQVWRQNFNGMETTETLTPCSDNGRTAIVGSLTSKAWGDSRTLRVKVSAQNRPDIEMTLKKGWTSVLVADTHTAPLALPPPTTSPPPSMTDATTTDAPTTGASTTDATTTDATTTGASTTGAPTTGAPTTGASTTGASTTGASTTGASTTGASSWAALAEELQSRLRTGAHFTCLEGQIRGHLGDRKAEKMTCNGVDVTAALNTEGGLKDCSELRLSPAYRVDVTFSFADETQETVEFVFQQ